jgi:hypothetical protein
MLIVFFNGKGIVHREFVPPNTMVNSDFYCDVSRHLRQTVPQKKAGTLVQPQLAPSTLIQYVGNTYHIKACSFIYEVPEAKIK